MFTVIGLKIRRGSIDLIHDYHQQRVTDKAGYARAFGNAMLIMAAAHLFSGVAALFGSDGAAPAAVAVLVVGLVIGLIRVVWVQRRYNKGIF
ncbi:MAG: hypothetical protein Q4A66_13430 [Eubacteriales bacterium]|nr:hypothetical protein [Eubacteriales bacterium]